MQRRSLIRSLPPLAILAGGGVLLAGCGGGSADTHVSAPPTAPAPAPAPTTETYVYVANQDSAVSAYRVQPDGGLQKVGPEPVPAGMGARSLAIHPLGTLAYVVNGDDENISSYAIDTETGSLKSLGNFPVPTPSEMLIHPSGKFAYVAGGAGILVYNVDSEGRLGEAEAMPASGAPAAIAVDPAGSYLYVAMGNDVEAFAIHPLTGALTRINSTRLSEPHSMAIAPSGKVLYVANIDDSISCHSVGSSSGFLGSPTFVNAGLDLGQVAVHPSGNYLYAACAANLDTYRVSAYLIDEETGALTLNLAGSASTSREQLRALAVGANGKAVYAVDLTEAGLVHAFAIGDAGELVRLGTSSAGRYPISINTVSITR